MKRVWGYVLRGEVTADVPWEWHFGIGCRSDPAFPEPCKCLRRANLQTSWSLLPASQGQVDAM
jgi:hypothetical protein